MSTIVSPGAEVQLGWNLSLLLIFAPYVDDLYSAYLCPIKPTAICKGILWMVCLENYSVSLA